MRLSACADWTSGEAGVPACTVIAPPLLGGVAWVVCEQKCPPNMLCEVCFSGGVFATKKPLFGRCQFQSCRPPPTVHRGDPGGWRDALPPDTSRTRPEAAAAPAGTQPGLHRRRNCYDPDARRNPTGGLPIFCVRSFFIYESCICAFFEFSSSSPPSPRPMRSWAWAAGAVRVRGGLRRAGGGGSGGAGEPPAALRRGQGAGRPGEDRRVAALRAGLCPGLGWCGWTCFVAVVRMECDTADPSGIIFLRQTFSPAVSPN